LTSLCLWSRGMLLVNNSPLLPDQCCKEYSLWKFMQWCTWLPIVKITMGKYFCYQETSKQTKKLCLENIVKLYLRVRSYSYAKDYISNFKMKQKAVKSKSLWKELKRKNEDINLLVAKCTIVIMKQWLGILLPEKISKN
jgi:hypothetical protein